MSAKSELQIILCFEILNWIESEIRESNIFELYTKLQMK
jgi:hypothetical protein